LAIGNNQKLIINSSQHFMEKMFLWNTLEPKDFQVEQTFTYGGETRESSDKWDPTTDDLIVSCNLSLTEDDEYLRSFLEPGETIQVGLFWRADRKFTGSSEPKILEAGAETSLECFIPRGYCSENISIAVNCFTSLGEGTSKDWGRPPGSQLAEIPVLEERFNKGSLFPIFEYDGDGKVLITWDFDSLGDLDMGISSALSILVDRNHILGGENLSNKDFMSLLTIQVIHGLAKKAFSNGLFEEITSNATNNPWRPDSVGGTLYFLLDKLRDELELSSFEALLELHNNRFEIIDGSIDRLFAEAIRKDLA